jgi:hypothetical protein
MATGGYYYVSTCDTGTYTAYDLTTTSGSATTITVWYTWAAADSTDNAWTNWTVETAGYYPLDESPAVESEADAKAKALLDQVLTEAQREEMAKYRYFTVESRTSKRRYRVLTDKGRHGNIEELDDQGRCVATLCCAPGGNIPHHDALIGQKLSLEAAEDDFRKAANRTERRAA